MIKEIEEEKIVYYCCGEELSEEDIFEFDGNIYCEDCLDKHTFICFHYEEKYKNNKNFGDSHINLCENIYIKTDRNLSDSLEIVLHHMTLDYHKNCVPWNDICEMALRLDYRNHNTKTYGLHIYVNRSVFKSSI